MNTMDGLGFVAIWNGIAAGHAEDFLAWHREEHMPERLAIPGFLRGQRWGRADGEGYFTLYTLQSPAVARSEPYLHRLNHPTPWTCRVMATFTANARCVGAFVDGVGAPPGDDLAAVPLHSPLSRPIADALQATFPKGWHWGQSDEKTTSLPIAERLGRTVVEPKGVLLVSVSEPDDFNRLKDLLGDRGAAAAIFRLQADMSRQD